MRRSLIPMAALAFASPALASIEPKPVASDPRVVQIMPKCEEGQERQCTAFVEGEPIILRGKVGQTLRVIFPQGWVVRTLAPSDEHLIRGIMVDRKQDRPGRDGAPNEGPVTPPERQGAETAADSTCTTTDSLSLCITRDRFLDVLASIPQTEQTFPVLLLFRKQGKPDVETNVDFLLSVVPTIPPEEDPASVPAVSMVRPVGVGVEKAKPADPPAFATVYVRLPEPVPAHAPPVAAQRVQKHRGRVVVPEPAQAPQPPRNSNYEAFGGLR